MLGQELKEQALRRLLVPLLSLCRIRLTKPPK